MGTALHGTNPQNLIEYIVRKKIYHSKYWKEHCFGLSAETLIDNGVELESVGGTIGGARKPTKFLCLILKMLQLQPCKDIAIELLRNEIYKYIRLLGALYLRLVGHTAEIYQYLCPLLNDYRKVRVQTVAGVYSLSHVDEIIDEFLTMDVVFDITLPRIQPRQIFVEQHHTTFRSNNLQKTIESSKPSEK